jgi:hypothetical protein
VSRQNTAIVTANKAATDDRKLPQQSLVGFDNTSAPQGRRVALHVTHTYAMLSRWSAVVARRAQRHYEDHKGSIVRSDIADSTTTGHCRITTG